MAPASPFMGRLADKHYCIGETYSLVEHHERSMKSHNHYFVQLAEYWQTLPESLADDYPTAEHLRKKALIGCGFATGTDFIFDTPRDAIAFAGIMAQEDEYCIVEVNGRTVRRWRAQSQSVRAMGKRAFQESKEAVLMFVDKLLAAKRCEEVKEIA